MPDTPREAPPPRPLGRPKAAEKGVAVMSWIKAGEYDKLVKLANQREATVSATVRALLTRRLP